MKGEQAPTEITICSNHPEYQVPLIWTFAFNGAECWCPYCGNATGMFGAGDRVPQTDELKERHAKYKKKTAKYLDAVGARVCSSLMWKGKRISPTELPQEEKDRLAKISSGGSPTKYIQIESFSEKELAN